MAESMTTKGDELVDGVVERLARDDVERTKFLRLAGKKIGAGAAATGLAAFIAACGSSSSSSSSATGSSSSAAAAVTTSADPRSSGSGDLAIVNYALTLEYLESQFYTKVANSGLFSGKTLSLLKSFGAEEAQHVIALRKVAASLGVDPEHVVLLMG